jgi:hypothetical protein
MNAWAVPYYFMRIVKWLLWIGFLIFSAYFVYDRAAHLDQFGNLSHTTEALLFGLPLVAVIVGLFELLFRDRAYPRLIVDR